MEQEAIKIKHLETKLAEALILLVRSLPYIQRDFDRSRFGAAADHLMRDIKKLAEEMNYHIDGYPKGKI